MESKKCGRKKGDQRVNGFLTLLFGLASINTLTVISVTRYIKGCHVNKGYYLNRSTISTSITCIWIEALFWAVVPLLGWASYTDSGCGTCGVDWSKAKYSTTYKAFIVTLIITCFVVPMLIMIFSYLSIIKKEKGRNVMSIDSYFHKRRKVEKDMTRVSIAICTAFVLAWSPYMLVSTCSAFGLNVPNSTRVVANLLAKSACCYNTFIYLIMSSKFRNDVTSLVPCLPETKDHVRLRYFKALTPKAESVQSDVNQSIMELLVEDKATDSNCQSVKFYKTGSSKPMVYSFCKF